MNLVLKFFKRYKLPLFLFGIVLAIFLTNYQPDTFLMGWDNLQSDLNPWLAVKRAFFAVWQEYQSFGLVSGLAHAADLPRALFMLIVSFILPQSLERYFFHHLMLFIGGLGMYQLLKFFGLNKEKSTIAFLGAVFYMLNFGAVQELSLPWEAFSTFFGFFPWQVWAFVKALVRVHRQNNHEPSTMNDELFVLFLINLLATPESYVQTIFVVYMAILGLLWIPLFFSHRSLAFFKRLIIVFLIIIAANSFWILPQLYFIKTGNTIVKQAKANQLSTENTVFINREKGDFNSFIRLEGFYYDTFGTNQRFLFERWKNHFRNPVFGSLPYLFFSIALLGLVTQRRYGLMFLSPWLLVAVALMSTTPPFSFVNDLLRHNEIVNQIFRSPFTKFVVPHALIYSVLFAFGVLTLLQLPKLRHKNYLISGLILVLIFLYSFSSFQGHYFLPAMKIKIPRDYFTLINYFKTQDKNKRIALLPDYTFWGWFHHRWGYDGSGFLWYGIEQPIVSRTFDVWSEKSEGYFWEMKSAAEAEDVTAFEKILEKYSVDYLVLDYSLLPVSATVKSMQYDRLEAVLKKTAKVRLLFRGENIALYSVKHDKKIDDFVSVVQSLPNIGPAIKLTNHDTAYFEYGDYYSDPNSPYEVYYPFLDLTTQTHLDPTRWKLVEEEAQFVLTGTLPGNPQRYTLPSFSSLSEATLFQKNEVREFSNLVTSSIHNNAVRVSFKKELVVPFIPIQTLVYNCGFPWGKITTIPGIDGLEVQAENGALSCFGYDAPSLEQQYSYLVRVDTKNSEGRRLFFYVLDKTKRQSFIEDRISKDTDYYIINPKYSYGLGYNFSFHNNSYANLSSTNTVNGLKVYLFPYDRLKQMKLLQENIVVKPSLPLKTFNAQKKNYFTYEIRLDESSNDNTFVVLHQAYNSGWKAYAVKRLAFGAERVFPFIFGKEIKEHFVVNNWANGWKLDPRSQMSDVRFQGSDIIRNQASVILVFWPQYLQFIGFGILFITAGVLFFSYRNRKSE